MTVHPPPSISRSQYTFTILEINWAFCTSHYITNNNYLAQFLQFNTNKQNSNEWIITNGFNSAFDLKKESIFTLLVKSRIHIDIVSLENKDRGYNSFGFYTSYDDIRLKYVYANLRKRKANQIYWKLFFCKFCTAAH
jgi:hypothetical protein